MAKILLLAATDTAVVRAALRYQTFDHVLLLARGTDIPADGGEAALLRGYDLAEPRGRVLRLPDSALADIAACSRWLADAFRELPRPDDTFCIDYQGTQPTLASALVLLALQQPGCTLAAARADGAGLLPAAAQQELTAVQFNAPALLSLRLAPVNDFVRRFQYAAAADYLRALSRSGGWTRERYTELTNILRGFDCWDRFAYAEAVIKLGATRYRDTYLPLLRRLTGEQKGNGFEAVFDLLRNAERMAARTCYDDAANRVYRAVELFAQCYLRKVYKQDSNNLDMGKLPAALRAKYAVHTYDDGTVKIGAFPCYELISELGDAFVGKIYREQKELLLTKVIRVRNSAHLAHGDDPMAPDAYALLHKVADEFLMRCCAAIGLKDDYPQFPSALDLA